MKFNSIEKWERREITSLTIQMIVMATIGTGIAVCIAILLQRMGISKIPPALLFIPWSATIVPAVSIAFHSGVLAERKRAARSSKGIDMGLRE